MAGGKNGNHKLKQIYCWVPRATHCTGAETQSQFAWQFGSIGSFRDEQTEAGKKETTRPQPHKWAVAGDRWVTGRTRWVPSVPPATVLSAQSMYKHAGVSRYKLFSWNHQHNPKCNLLSNIYNLSKKSNRAEIWEVEGTYPLLSKKNVKESITGLSQCSSKWCPGHDKTSTERLMNTNIALILDCWAGRGANWKSSMKYLRQPLVLQIMYLILYSRL